MTIVAAVRAPAPNLDTWWTKWEVPIPDHAPAEILIDEVRNGREQFRRRIDDWLGVDLRRRAG
ncbi:hypothetical protein ACW2Q0_04355 [Nocardia sp. R16R-3T]